MWASADTEKYKAFFFPWIQEAEDVLGSEHPALDYLLPACAWDSFHLSALSSDDVDTCTTLTVFLVVLVIIFSDTQYLEICWVFLIIH